MENQWLAHAKWEIFSLICGQLISILNNQTNYCKRKLLSLTLLHLLSGVLSWKAKSSGAFETLETPQAWSWMLEQSFKKIPINFTFDLRSDLFWKWLFDLLFNFMCHLFVICGSALAKKIHKDFFSKLDAVKFSRVRRAHVGGMSILSFSKVIPCKMFVIFSWFFWILRFFFEFVVFFLILDFPHVGGMSILSFCKVIPCKLLLFLEFCQIFFLILRSFCFLLLIFRFFPILVACQFYPSAKSLHIFVIFPNFFDLLISFSF